MGPADAKVCVGGQEFIKCRSVWSVIRFVFLDSILKTHERVRMCALVSDVDPVCNYKRNGLERNPEPARDTWT